MNTHKQIRHFLRNRALMWRIELPLATAALLFVFGVGNRIPGTGWASLALSCVAGIQIWRLERRKNMNRQPE